MEFCNFFSLLLVGDRIGLLIAVHSLKAGLKLSVLLVEITCLFCEGGQISLEHIVD